MSKISYKFVKLSSDVLPTFNVDNKGEIVKYGEDNLLPNKLLELSTQSSLHTAILDKKVKMSVGDGLSYDGATNKKTQDFIDECNPYEGLNDILEKCAVDLEIFGGFSLEVIWSKDKTQIAEVYHMPYQHLRSSKLNEDNQVDYLIYNRDWTSYTSINQCKLYPVFNKNINKEDTQVLYSKKYTATNSYYPLPSYIGAINDINTLYQISVFNNACVTNNFQPGIMIIFRGSLPTPDEQDDIIKGLEEKYKGSKNAGTPAVFFLDSDQEEPTIEQSDVSDLDKQYTILTGAIKESVVMGHSIPRPVAGLETEGSLGSSKEVIEGRMLFYNDYIKYEQNFILKALNKIGKINGLKKFKINNPSPSALLYSENILDKILTQNEIRSLFGYDELEVEEITIEENTIEIEEDIDVEKNNDKEDE